MGIFSQSKNPIKAVSENDVEVVNDFLRRTPYWSYRPESYGIYEPFLNYMPEIDSYLEKLFNGEVDSGNGDVLDMIIGSVTRQAKHALEKQHCNHRDIIKSFDIRAKSDKKAFEDQRSRLQAELDEMNEEFGCYKELIVKDSFVTRRK